MKALIRLTIIISAFIFLSENGFGQTVDSVGGGRVGSSVQRGLTNMRPEFYRKTMDLDTSVAKGVAGVQDAYKAALELVVRDSSLALDTRRERIRLLMADKNDKLRGLLDADKQQKAIPTTELKGEKTEHLVK